MNDTNLDLSKVSFNELIRAIHAHPKTDGIAKPLDKCKYREIQIAEKLGHTVFVGASGGKNNDDTYGADATDANGNKAEYKSRSVSERDMMRLTKKGYLDFGGVYNGAYTAENIDRYRSVDHYFSVHYENGDLIAVVKVDTDTVIDSLHAWNTKREIRTDKILAEAKVNGKRPKVLTTNCNAVGVRVYPFALLTGTEKYEIVYWNSEYL